VGSQRPARGRALEPTLLRLVALSLLCGLPLAAAAAGEFVQAGGDAFCTDGVSLDAVKARLHWAHVRNPALCGSGLIAEPAGDWTCIPVPVCGTPEAESAPAPAPVRCVPAAETCRQGFQLCHRRYRCRAQSEDYNFEKLGRERRDAVDRRWDERTRSDGPRVDTCAALAEHLAACTAFRCERTHPVLTDVTLRFEVVGRAEAGCQIRETLAGGLLRTCTVPDAPPASPGAPAAPPDGDPLARALQGAECEVDLEADPPAQ
jgi:hypothetical protein